MKDISAQHQDMLRYHNSKSVIRIIQANKCNPISRADIAMILQMSPTSITRIIASLLELDLIRQEEAFSKGVGRKGINICINKNAFYSLGFAIDCDYLKLSIVDCEDVVIAEDMARLDTTGYHIDLLLRQGYQMFLNLCNKNTIDKSLVTCMGISCCGLVDYKKGISCFSPQLGWKNLNVRQAAELIFQLPVCVDNDIKMALIGATHQSEEMRNADVVYLSIGSGVGVAVMYHGELVRGINNAAGEIGHTMFSLNGRQCVCGKRGCMSAYISEPGIVKECYDHGRNVKEFKDVMDCYEAGDSWAEDIVEELTDNMAIVFSDMIYSYNPKFLLIGGNIVVDYPNLYERAKEKVFELMNEDFNLDIMIKKRDFKNNEALGAAFAAQEQYIDKLLK